MRRTLPRIAAAIAFLTMAAVPSSAQVVSVFAPGARLRLITPELQASQQTVTVVSATSDSVAFRSQSYPVTRTLPLSAISAVEVRSDGERPFLRNMIIGGGLGAGAGAVIAAAAYEECEDCWFYEPSRSKDALGGAILGGLAGVLSGIVVAAAQPGERWTRIPLNANVAVRASPAARFALVLTRSF